MRALARRGCGPHGCSRNRLFSNTTPFVRPEPPPVEAWCRWALQPSSLYPKSTGSAWFRPENALWPNTSQLAFRAVPGCPATRQPGAARMRRAEKLTRSGSSFRLRRLQSSRCRTLQTDTNRLECRAAPGLRPFAEHTPYRGARGTFGLQEGQIISSSHG